MPLSCPRQSTNLFGRVVGTTGCILLICLHPAAKHAHKVAHKIPTDPRPLTSLAVGFGVCGDTAADKEGSE